MSLVLRNFVVRRSSAARNFKLHGCARSFAKETKRAYDPPPDAPSSANKYAIFFGVTGMLGLAYLYTREKNDYGISWYADQTLDESKIPVSRPGTGGSGGK
jgi:hypothetical protein